MSAGECRYSTAAALLVSGAPKRRERIELAYLTRYEPVAQERVRFAGFRLAHIINLALDPNYTGPVRNSTQPP